MRVDEAEIVHQVKIARAHDIPFLTTGGGHGTSDWSSFKGISIDLGLFKSTQMEDNNQFITIGGATEYSQVGAALYEVGKELRTFFN
jgi:FAD/FMN-containing dehydrogenase